MFDTNAVAGLVSGISLLGMTIIATPSPAGGPPPEVPTPSPAVFGTSHTSKYYLNVDDFFIKNSRIAGTTPISPTPTITPSATPTRIPTRTPTPRPLPPSSLDQLFERFANEFHVDMLLLKKIALCESGFNPNSSGSGGQYLGLFQFSTGAWISARTRMGMDTNQDLRTNAEESIRTAAFTISKNGAGAWPSCSR